MSDKDQLSFLNRRCETCRYELTGLSCPRCPECGQPFDPESPAGGAASRDRIRWADVLAGTLGFFLVSAGIVSLFVMKHGEQSEFPSWFLYPVWTIVFAPSVGIGMTIVWLADLRRRPSQTLLALVLFLTAGGMTWSLFRDFQLPTVGLITLAVFLITLITALVGRFLARTTAAEP
jgi:tryptophan-rich sensory protein